jgi:hypothetical protein
MSALDHVAGTLRRASRTLRVGYKNRKCQGYEIAALRLETSATLTDEILDLNDRLLGRRLRKRSAILRPRSKTPVGQSTIRSAYMPRLAKPSSRLKRLSRIPFLRSRGVSEG